MYFEAPLVKLFLIMIGKIFWFVIILNLTLWLIFAEKSTKPIISFFHTRYLMSIAKNCLAVNEAVLGLLFKIKLWISFYNFSFDIDSKTDKKFVSASASISRFSPLRKKWRFNFFKESSVFPSNDSNTYVNCLLGTDWSTVISSIWFVEILKISLLPWKIIISSWIVLYF